MHGNTGGVRMICFTPGVPCTPQEGFPVFWHIQNENKLNRENGKVFGSDVL